MESVKAKFIVSSIERFEHNSWVRLTVDTSKKSEDFSKYTPGGEMKIMITNDAPALDFFNPGDRVALTFTKED